MLEFIACRQKVFNRGSPPSAFLGELVLWGRGAASEIFSESETLDIFASITPVLGPWRNDAHRKAALLEVLRVLGEFESSWNWLEGRDTTNKKSNKPCTEESGIFQCSVDSMAIDPSLRQFFVSVAGKSDCDTFRAVSKSNHQFAIEYCARLIRFTIRHHGPIRDRHIHTCLRRDAVAEFELHLS